MSDPAANQFAGKSTLRKPVKKEVKKNPALQAYLSKYTDGPSGEQQSEYKEPKKKKKKVKALATPAAVQIVDNDVTGFSRGLSPARRRMLEGSDEEDEGAPAWATIPSQHDRPQPAVRRACTPSSQAHRRTPRPFPQKVP